jgi:hypothetical protein
MAQILKRHERKVRAAVTSLGEDGLIGIDHTDAGLPKTYWPNVPRCIADMSPASAWFVDALSDKPVWGRPKLVEKPRPDPSKTPAGSVQSISLKDITPPFTSERNSHLSKDLHSDRVVAATPVKGGSHE